MTTDTITSLRRQEKHETQMKKKVLDRKMTKEAWATGYPVKGVQGSSRVARRQKGPEDDGDEGEDNIAGSSGSVSHSATGTPQSPQPSSRTSSDTLVETRKRGLLVAVAALFSPSHSKSVAKQQKPRPPKEELKPIIEYVPLSRNP